MQNVKTTIKYIHMNIKLHIKSLCTLNIQKIKARKHQYFLALNYFKIYIIFLLTTKKIDAIIKQ